MSTLRALLTGVVDYAGLFPPAGLDMAVAVRNYAAYQAHDESWMLGRFVLPAARLDDLGTQLDALGEHGGREWRVSALIGADLDADVERVRAFDRAQRGRACVDSLEGKFDSVEAIRRAAATIGQGFAVFAEIPLGTSLESLVGAAKDAGINAKIRTGGVITDAFPSPATVVRFIRCCISAQVRFKATAGLHHAMRGDYRLTYAADAPTGPMFGFLNVVVAAGLMGSELSDGDAAQLLDERDPGAITITADAIRWRGVALDEEHARSLRDDLMVSFGSCSFVEPVAELRSLVPLS